MANKITYLASEILLKETKLPDLLINEISEFKKRNLIIKNHYCQSCLKAHLVKRASVLEINKKLFVNVLNKIDGKIGHEGYYLDKGNLIKI